MTIKEIREKLIAAKKQADELLTTVAERDGKITSEEREKYDKMVEDMRSYGATVKAMEDEERRTLELATPNNDPPPPGGDDDPDTDNGDRSARPPANQPRAWYEPAGSFRNFGDFVCAACLGDHERGGELRELQMGEGKKGGFLVPDKWNENVLMVNPETEIVMPLASTIPAGGESPDAREHFPALSQGESGALGGLTFTWLEEGGTKQETDFDLEDIAVEPKEFAAYVVITDKLLRNSVPATALLMKLLNMGVPYNRDLALLKGDGVGKPKGVYLSDAAIKVVRNTANAVKFADVVNMLTAVMPESEDAMRFIAHTTVKPQLYGMEDSSGNSIFIAGDVTKGLSATLLGHPIRWTGKTYGLGTQGDLALIDFSYYLVKEGSGPFVAASEHVLFTKNKTVVKVFANIDGQCWMSAPLTLDDGSTQVSPIILLK